MGYLTKFGYDERYFNDLLIQTIAEDPVLEKEDDLKTSLCELIANGGKRIRPLFLLMATELGDKISKEDRYLAAVAIELLHLSSLIHDDIIDHSSVRHNVLTLHERYNKTIALKLGNYTLNRSLELFASFPFPPLHLQLADTMKQLCLGELQQQDNLFNFNLSLEDYIKKSDQKTGTLISASLVIGGILAHANEEKLDELKKLGSSIGIAYQIKDDILDFSGDSPRLGKPVGHDLKEGVVTLPTIFALEDDLLKDDLSQIYQQCNWDTPLLDLLCQRISHGESIKKSEELCKTYINITRSIAKNFPLLQPKINHLISLIFN